MTMELRHLLFLALCSMTAAQRFAPGPCPKITPMAPFERTKFLGYWVETEKTPSFFDMIMRCMEYTFADAKDGSLNVAIKGTSLGNLPMMLNGDGVITEATTQGRYTIRYSFGVPVQGTQITVLDTDYDNYATVYSCTNSLIPSFFHTEYISIYSKIGEIDNPTRQNIYEKLDMLGVNRDGISIIDRTACPITTRETEHKDDTDANRESDNTDIKNNIQPPIVELLEVAAPVEPATEVPLP